MALPRPVGRPVTKVLTEAKIISEARRQLVLNGRFTMYSIAKELKVVPSSIYNHLASKDEVLAGISDSVIAEIDTSSLVLASAHLAEGIDLDSRKNLWLDATYKWAYSYWKVFSSSTELTATLSVTPIANAPQTLRMYETVVSTFLDFGWHEDDVLIVLEMIESYIFGASLDAAAPFEVFDPGADSAVSPRLAGAYRQLRKKVDNPAELAFQRGLTTLLRGLAADLL